MMRIGRLIASGAVALALAGCGGHTESVKLQTYTPPSAAPVAVATVQPVPRAKGTCTVQSSSQPFDPDTNQYTSPTYSVTLTNTSSVPDDVSQIATVFYSDGDTELGSDQESASGIIAPDQSLTWTFDVPSNLIATPDQIGTVTAANDDGAYWNIGDPLDQAGVLAASCQFEQWG